MKTGSSALTKVLSEAFGNRPKARQSITTRTTGRRFASVGTEQARAVLDPLPAPGETIHFTLGAASFPLWHILPAVLGLTSKPFALDLATLGMRPEVADWIGEQMKAGKITRCTAILSHYFRHSDPQAAEHCLDALRAAGVVARICRCHAKIILMDPGKDRLTVESSANLRSCRALEQATITNDASLYRFHHQWMHHLLNYETDDRKPS